MNYDPKPCPFCGNADVKTLPVDMNEAKDFFILCEECGAQGPTNRQFVDETVAAWNRRVVTTIVPEPTHAEREHEMSIDCWCKPVRDAEEPGVIIHNRTEH